MSILTKLYIEDHDPLNVLESQFSVRTPIDHMKRPQGVPVPGLLSLTIEAAKEEFLWPWATATLDKKQVELHYIPATLNERTRKLFLSDVHLVGYKFNFKSTGEHPVTLSLKLAFAGLEDSITDSSYSAHWRETFPISKDVEETTLQEEESLTPKIIDWFLTNSKNERIDSADYEDKVYLNIISKNLLGEEVTINLKNPRIDYIHQGNRLKNDTLKNHVISNNNEKIELTVVEQEY